MAIEGRTEQGMPRRLKLGMVGGGEGAFIGGVDRIAARIDDQHIILIDSFNGNALYVFGIVIQGVNLIGPRWHIAQGEGISYHPQVWAKW